MNAMGTGSRGGGCRALILVVVAAALALWTYRGEAAADYAGPKAAEIEALFSPGDECEGRIIEEIEGANKRIRVQMYFFTSKKIASALGKAAKRGVSVEVLLDKSQEKMTYGPWRVLRRDGVKVYFDDEHQVANNKVMLVDTRTVVTGSYNFTKAAEEENAENLIIVKHHAEIFDRYLENYKRHLDHARKADG